MKAPSATTELRAVATSIFARSDLAPTSARVHIIGLLHQVIDSANELEAAYTPRRAVIAEAVTFAQIVAGINTAGLEARRLGCLSLADRLDSALRVANSFADSAQLNVLRILNLPIDYTAPNDIGAKLDSGGASLLELLALDRVPDPA